MVFCNNYNKKEIQQDIVSHNPYFSRWFSAIKKYIEQEEPEYGGHNPYFSRWFSAI